MEGLRHNCLLNEDNISGCGRWREAELASPPGVASRLSRFLGEDYLVGLLYGVVNWIVCVPGLVSYAHIVFSQREFSAVMPFMVKIYFLSSAVMQATMTLQSSIPFSIGQVQDVGLIFLAGMVRNVVAWARQEGLSTHEVLATSLWTCASSTFLVGIFLVVIGRMQLTEYVQMIPLPVVGGYLGYIGYFCLAAGLSIGSGKEVSGPTTMVQLADPELQTKLALLTGMTAVMFLVHINTKHFMWMPATLLFLPVAFFVGSALLGISVEECRAAGWLPPFQPAQAAPGLEAFGLFDPGAVRWSMLPRQFINVCGLAIIVTFGSSLDIAAIQAEMAGQKIDYSKELVTIGLGNVASGLAGGATGSYIFSQTIFSAKRGVRSRLNGLVVCLGEILLFLMPIDVLHVLPNSYIGGIMCLCGVDIMCDWLIQSRSLMAPFEYALVWVSFGSTMWLAGKDTFGVIEGMALGILAASLVFVVQYTNARDAWQPVSGRSSVVRPPKERQLLQARYRSVLAVSLNSFAFFGASLRTVQGIESAAEQQGARFVCFDMGRLSGMDSTAAGQLRLLALALERMGMTVILSSVRSEVSRRLLEAHSVIGGDSGRLVFGTLDQALQHCEEELLRVSHTVSRTKSQLEHSLDTLLLEYVDGFVSDRRLAVAHAEAAGSLVAHFHRLQLLPGEAMFLEDDAANEIFVIAAGSVQVCAHRDWVERVASEAAVLPSPARLSIVALARQASGDSACDTDAHFQRSRHDLLGGDPLKGINRHPDGESVAVGVGGILGDTAFYARRRCGCDAIAGASGCVAYVITRKTMEQLELSDPRLVMFLQKVFLRDLTQLQVQFMGPLQAAGGLS